MFDPRNLLSKSPQKSQRDTIESGVKGIVVDVRDPLLQGRCKILPFSISGPFAGLDIANLKWSEPRHAFKGNFAPPKLWDRVWVDFENGDKYTPIYSGGWYAIPNGAGTLPFDSPTGSEVPMCAWSSADLVPENTVVAHSAEGSDIVIEEKNLNGENAYSSIYLEDTGGKQIKTWSMHLGQKPYGAVQRVDNINNGSLDGLSIPASIPIRDGSQPIAAADVPGAIEFETVQIQRSMITDDSGSSVDSWTQYDANQDLGFSQTAMDGELFDMSLGSSNFGMTKQSAFISANQVFMGNMVTPPIRYNQSSNSEARRERKRNRLAQENSSRHASANGQPD